MATKRAFDFKAWRGFCRYAAAALHRLRRAPTTIASPAGATGCFTAIAAGAIAGDHELAVPDPVALAASNIARRSGQSSVYRVCCGPAVANWEWSIAPVRS